MELPTLNKDRLLSITDSINHASQTSNGHLPDKISCILTNIELLKLEVEKLKKMRKARVSNLTCRCGKPYSQKDLQDGMCHKCCAPTG